MNIREKIQNKITYVFCQEAAVGTKHGINEWFKIGKGGWQGCILSPCLFNLCVEYIMGNAGLDATQAGIKITGGNINILRYADNTTLMAKSEEELKSLLMKVKEGSEEVGLKLDIQKMKIMASSSITSWQTEGEKVEVVTDFFLGSKITADYDCSHEIKRCVLLGRKDTANLWSILKSGDIGLEAGGLPVGLRGSWGSPRRPPWPGRRSCLSRGTPKSWRRSFGV